MRHWLVNWGNTQIFLGIPLLQININILILATSITRNKGDNMELTTEQRELIEETVTNKPGTYGCQSCAGVLKV